MPAGRRPRRQPGLHRSQAQGSPARSPESTFTGAECLGPTAPNSPDQRRWVSLFWLPAAWPRLPGTNPLPTESTALSRAFGGPRSTPTGAQSPMPNGLRRGRIVLAHPGQAVRGHRAVRPAPTSLAGMALKGPLGSVLRRGQPKPGSGLFAQSCFGLPWLELHIRS